MARTRKDKALSEDPVAAVAEAVAAIGTPGFALALADAVLRIVPYHSGLVLGARPGRPPVLLHDGLGDAERAAFKEAYLGGAYLIAAGYRAAQDTGIVGVRHIGEVFPGDLATSRYFAEYWGRTGMIDEAFMFFRPDRAHVVWLAFGRYAGGEPFSAAELERLRSIEPVLIAAAHKHWAGGFAIESPSLEADGIHDRSKRRLAMIGKDVLTPREYEVCQLMLRGHSSKSAARVLDISPETERIHRRHVFSKLGVSSQVEVLSQFIAALSGDGGPPHWSAGNEPGSKNEVRS